MLGILQSLQPYSVWISCGAAIFAVICFILALVSMVKNKRLEKRLQHWRTISSSEDLEGVFEHTQEAVRSLRQQVLEMEQYVQRMEEELKHKVSTPKMRRFNAFAEVGSDLSYSVAFLDSAGDGVVLTSIYGRDDSVTYGKPIQQGESTYQLTVEEQQVVDSSLGSVPEDKVMKTS